MESLRSDKPEDSLLIFGSVNVDGLKTRISKPEERPSKLSWLWVTLLAQETLDLKQLPQFPKQNSGSKL